VRAYKNSANQSQKMLASTVQFSTYDQTPPTRPRQTPDSPQGTRRYEKQNGPVREETSPGDNPEPAPSGPNSVPTNQTPPPTAFHAPPAPKDTMTPY
jgi:hypothetical protein